jgi:hypothetical protein
MIAFIAVLCPRSYLRADGTSTYIHALRTYEDAKGVAEHLDLRTSVLVPVRPALQLELLLDLALPVDLESASVI